MQFKWFNPRFVHVHAVPYERFLNEGRLIQTVVEKNQLPLMVAVIKRQPETVDIETNALLAPGTCVLLKGYNEQGSVFIEPLDGQELMEDGDYAVVPAAILAILEDGPENLTDSAEAAPLSGGAGDPDGAMAGDIAGGG